jgi:uncharacterized 2Fe-2S/4Fe-4S cluster protein (DUF4445 family)
MPLVTFLPQERTVRAAPGDALIDVARAAGILLASECGGKGTCGSCMILVEQGAVSGDSSSFLPAPAVEEGFVLACRSSIGEQDVTLRLAATGTAPTTGQFAEAIRPDSKVPGATGATDTPDAAADHPLRRAPITVPEPQPEDGLSDLDRLERALLLIAGAQSLHCPLPLLRSLPLALRQSSGRVSCTWFSQGSQACLLDLRPGAPDAPLLGAAVDLGTTSLAVQLLDLETGAVLAGVNDHNPQRERGLDVISRINFAQRPGGLEELRGLVVSGVNDLLHRAAAEAGRAQDEIMALSLAGNTVMTHLLLGVEPEYVRLAPYTPAVLRPAPLRAEEIGLNAHSLAPVLLAPGVGSYVGGDIVAGLLCTPLADADNADSSLRLYLDIGTNGEVVVGDGDFLMGCACSAGPAFEGGGLRCGMCAATGAVERCDVDPETGAPRLGVIGEGPVAGICGSGAIELLAALFRTGWLDAAGRFERERPSPHIRIQGRHAAYVLALAAESATGQEVLLTEADIDNLLRAKAAIHAGCALLLERAGLDFTDLTEVIVAGGFGRFLDVEAAVTIGLLPDLPRERFRFIGNASLAGATRTLRSRREQERQAALADRLTYVELSSEPAYMDQYTAALFLPHTDAARFPSVTARHP